MWLYLLHLLFRTFPPTPILSRLPTLLHVGSSASNSWEWREGRLLTYELVLRFLVANHVHCLFPAALARSPRRPPDLHIDSRRRWERGEGWESYRREREREREGERGREREISRRYD